jgi:hypothetical protein
MLGVGLRAFYRHLAASLFLRLLSLLVSHCHGFIVRPACVVQGHFVDPSRKKVIATWQSAQRVSFTGLRFELLA